MYNIAVVNTLLVPSGEASVNRILSYSKGLVEMGDKVTVLSSAFSEKPRGEINGIGYINLGKGRGLKSLILALLMMLKTIWTNKYDAIILVSNSLFLIYPIVAISKIRGIKILQEKSEFPFVLLKQGLINKLYAKIYVSTTYRLFDGLVVMTSPLKDYFANKVRKDCIIIEVPMTVDLNRFDIERSQVSSFGKYVAYCGDMSGNKDGVENLIKAFSIASKILSDIKLLLIGGSSNDVEYKRLKSLADNECPGKVIFYGRVSREAIPQLLKDAHALALARPSSLQSSGGFPTKLGEYLATGNPVLVTAVGDIPKYLNDDNAFIVRPDDNQAFADKIIALFQDYDNARKVGLKGRRMAQSTFNYQVQSPRIHQIIEQLCE